MLSKALSRSALAPSLRCFSSISAIEAEARGFREAVFGKVTVDKINEQAGIKEGDAEIGEMVRKEAAGSFGLVPQSLSVGSSVEVCSPASGSFSVLVPEGEEGKREVERIMLERKEQDYRFASPSSVLESLERWLEHFCMKESQGKVVSQVAVWGEKTIGDSKGEVEEVTALMLLALEAARVGEENPKFSRVFSGNGKDAVVVPPNNFPLLGLKDSFGLLLQGHRVLLAVQPRFFRLYQGIVESMQSFLAPSLLSGPPSGVLEVLPLVSRKAGDGLEEALFRAQVFRFTGSSKFYFRLCKQAIERGNVKLNYGGEISGLNQSAVLSGVPLGSPALHEGLLWSVAANNGELCTSTSLIACPGGEDVPFLQEKLERLWQEKVNAGLISDKIEDPKLLILKKKGKQESLRLVPPPSSGSVQEFWDKTAVLSSSASLVSTDQSLGYCVYGPNLEKAVQRMMEGQASCLYGVAVRDAPPEAQGGEWAPRAGTTGCKVPESVFGGHKSYTSAVAGDHDGVGSLQTMLGILRMQRGGYSHLDYRSRYELPLAAEDLLTFLPPQEQPKFLEDLFAAIDFCKGLAEEPEIHGPYPGQPMVRVAPSEGDEVAPPSHLLTLKAFRSTRKHLLVKNGIEIPSPLVKQALLELVLPVRAFSAKEDVSLHVVNNHGEPEAHFVKFVEKSLKWPVVRHESMESLSSWVSSSSSPPYFYGTFPEEDLSPSFLAEVAAKGGFVYSGFPSDPVQAVKRSTCQQSWTVSLPSSSEEAVNQASNLLLSNYRLKCLKEEEMEMDRELEAFKAAPLEDDEWPEDLEDELVEEEMEEMEEDAQENEAEKNN